jgi:hypothetical protein
MPGPYCYHYEYIVTKCFKLENILMKDVKLTGSVQIPQFSYDTIKEIKINVLSHSIRSCAANVDRIYIF